MSAKPYQVGQSDIDAAWQLMLAVAPHCPELLTHDGALSTAALAALQARLTLVMRLGAGFVPVRQDWLEAATALSHSAQQLAHQSEAFQAAGVPAPTQSQP